MAAVTFIMGDQRISSAHLDDSVGNLLAYRSSAASLGKPSNLYKGHGCMVRKECGGQAWREMKKGSMPPSRKDRRVCGSVGVLTLCTPFRSHTISVWYHTTLIWCPNHHQPILLRLTPKPYHHLTATSTPFQPADKP